MSERRKWEKVKSPQYPNGKLCKEMSQESKDKLHAYEIMQKFRYPPLELLYNTSYIENHTVPLDRKGPPKPNREWRRDTREW